MTKKPTSKSSDNEITRESDDDLIRLHVQIKRSTYNALKELAYINGTKLAEEARVTAEIMGQRVEMVCDVGVAGLHRLLGHLPQLQDLAHSIAINRTRLRAKFRFKELI